MKVIALPSALFAALYYATAAAATAIPQSSFVLAPLYTPPPPPSSADDQLAIQTNHHIVQDSYLVVLQDHLDDHDITQHHQHVEKVHNQHQHARLVAATAPGAHSPRHGIKHRYNVGGKKNKHSASKKAARKLLKGYSGHFNEETVDAIRAMKGVKYVERDSLVWASDIEKGAPWGLARISHRNTLSFSTYNRYEYETQAGTGVDAYVIDTGVNVDHVELEGRAKWGKTIPNDPDQDLNGHGSHVAGTIASAKYGVAKKANIIAVKVLGAGGSGTMSDVVAGVAWAADSAAEAAQLKAQGKNPKHKGSVANMSLGGGKSQALDDAVDAAVEDGLHFAVAAGNDNRDACSYSPAASVGAITVGASTIADERAYFSNHGKCVDIFAPGLNILSIWNSGNRSINTISGTSMASPHIAGLAAYLLGTEWASSAALDEALAAASSASSSGFAQSFGQFAFGKKLAGKPEDHLLSPKALKKAMLKIATKGALHDLNAGSPNLLSFNNYTAPATPKSGGKFDAIDAALVEAYLDDLKDDLREMKEELKAEVDEVTELMKEFAAQAFEN
ncbi:hypothetical protein JCM6882_008219 [Rhodosporidiobolus microsporus]